MPADPFRAFLPAASLGFTGAAFDRTDDLRRDQAWIGEMRRRPDARWLLFRELKPLMQVQDGVPDLLWFPGEVAEAALAPATDWAFLGLDEAGTPHFAAHLPPDAAVTGAASAEPWELRPAAIAMGTDARIAVLGQARSLLAWHETHHFCARCGSPTAISKSGYARQCENASCAAEHFPRVDPVVIMLVVDGDSCLLGRQPHFAPGMYSALAGFVEPGESLEEAVRREVWEEAGIRADRVRYVASQPWPFPSSLMVGCFAEALSRDLRIDETELEDARWFSRADVRAALNDAGPFNCPPPIAIARHLLEAWAFLGE